MRFENSQGWIEIEFENYAEDSEFWRSGLVDERNSVELGFNFSLEEIGWGCVGEEYFLTTDIKELATGAAKVLFSSIKEFSYSVAFPYGVLLDTEFCKFRFSRCENGIEVNLRIWDGLCEYIEITQIFDDQGFEAIVQDLKEATKRFHVR